MSQASLRGAPDSGPTLSQRRRALQQQLRFRGALSRATDRIWCGHGDEAACVPCVSCGRKLCSQCCTAGTQRCRDSGNCNRWKGTRDQSRWTHDRKGKGKHAQESSRVAEMRGEYDDLSKRQRYGMTSDGAWVQAAIPRGGVAHRVHQRLAGSTRAWEDSQTCLYCKATSSSVGGLAYCEWCGAPLCHEHRWAQSRSAIRGGVQLGGAQCVCQNIDDCKGRQRAAQ